MSDEGMGVIVGFTLGAFIAGGLVAGCSEASWKRRAVESGNAEFYLDKDSERQWRWRPACQHRDCQHAELPDALK